MKILDRYCRTADKKVMIDIAAGRVEDLYNDLDKYAPYRKKDLDQDLVEYLIDAVSEIGKEDFVIRFRFAVLADMDLRSRVQRSIHNYFQYLKVLELRELAKMTRSTFILFSIGIVLLFLSVWSNQKIAGYDGVITQVFAEGITVAAWVSLWNAITNFLINWVPHHQQLKMYERISNARIIFHEMVQGDQQQEDHSCFSQADEGDQGYSP
ncbi:MAG: hypothetical protein PHZ02_00515 [Desulfocapsaceae bacterium]|nr:hypothetical protein [Desulfocapsaceae bacterium]